MTSHFQRHLAQMDHFGKMLADLARDAVTQKKLAPAVLIDVMLFTALGSMRKNGIAKEEAMRQLAEMWEISDSLPATEALGLNQGEA